jgi:hypothetical protein
MLVFYAEKITCDSWSSTDLSLKTHRILVDLIEDMKGKKIYKITPTI